MYGCVNKCIFSCLYSEVKCRVGIQKFDFCQESKLAGVADIWYFSHGNQLGKNYRHKRVKHGSQDPTPIEKIIGLAEDHLELGVLGRGRGVQPRRKTTIIWNGWKEDVLNSALPLHLIAWEKLLPVTSQQKERATFAVALEGGFDGNRCY